MDATTRREWLMAQLAGGKHPCLDVSNGALVDEYARMVGLQPSDLTAYPRMSLDLVWLHKAGRLVRCKIAPNQPDGPRWCYSYSLPR